MSPDVVQALAGRPAPRHPVAEDRVGLSAKLSAHLGVAVGDVVELSTAQAKPVYVAVQHGDGDSAAHTAHLGRLLWQQLCVRPGDAVGIRRADLPVAGKVVLQPAFHLSRHLTARFVEAARAARTVLSPGAKFFVPVFPGGGGVRALVVEIDQPALAGAQTEFVFLDPDPDGLRAPAGLADVGGLAGQIARLRELVELPLVATGLYRSLGIQPPRGVILHGPPGTGKTLLSRSLAAEIGVGVRAIAATQLVGSYSGETEANLRSLFDEAAHHAPTLIVIDEIDVLTTSRGQLASQSDIRAVTQLLSLMDGLEQVDGVVVLATTNRMPSVDEAFRRPGRFDEELYIGPPDAAARAEIVAIHSRDMPLTAEADQALRDAVRDATAGFTGADLMRLCREAGLAAARRTAPAGLTGIELAGSLRQDLLAVESEDIAAALGRVAPSAMRSITTISAEAEWDDVVGLDQTKATLLELASRAIAGSGPSAEAVLLHGAPGSGKSFLVNALARQVGANLVQIDGADVFTQWLGESETALRELFDKALQVAPTILAIEHLDALAPTRATTQTENAARRVLAALLGSIDAAMLAGTVLVVGITDRPELVDPSVVRTGRLGTHLALPAPDAARRTEIARRALGGDVESIVAATDGLSVAELYAHLRQPTTTEA